MSDKDKPPVDHSFLLGQAIERINRLQSDFEKLEAKMGHIDSLMFWERIFKAAFSFMFGLLAAAISYIALFFWNNPEKWTALVKFLK
jgi:hypothetical protein